MSQDCDRAGVFRGQITECGLSEVDSGAKAINIKASLEEYWDSENKAWVPWAEYEMIASGAIWIIKKDGTVNTKAVESAVNYAGWNGSMEDAANGIFSAEPMPCQFVVNEEKPNDYHTDTQYRVAFINDYDRTPGANGNVSADRAKALQAQYGAQFRALGGNAQRNSAAPSGKPTAPKPKAKPNGKKPTPVIPTDQNLERDMDAANRKLDEAAVKAGDQIPF